MSEMLSSWTFAGLRLRMQRNFPERVKALKTNKLDLLHLLLHEIAFHVLGTNEQDPRDDWAFNELPKHRYFSDEK